MPLHNLSPAIQELKHEESPNFSKSKIQHQGHVFGLILYRNTSFAYYHSYNTKKEKRTDVFNEEHTFGALSICGCLSCVLSVSGIICSFSCL